MRRWWVLLVLVVLVVAVILVRPGTQATDENLAVASPSVVPSSPPSHSGSVQGPSDLPADLGIASVVMSALGAGPLMLGTSREDLAEAGWTFRYGLGDCTRVVPVVVGDVAFSGWLVNGQLSSAQVEMADLLGRTSPSGLGFTFGRPLAEAEGFDRRTRQAGTSGPGAVVEVGVGSRTTDGVDVLISDLGQYGVRYAEVRLAGSPDCVVDIDGVGEAETATVAALSADVAPSLAPGLVGPTPDLRGADLEQLRDSGSLGAGVAAGLTAEGCELAETTTSEGTTQLFMQDGVVVAQRFLDPGVDRVPESQTWTVSPGGALVQRTWTSFQVTDPASGTGLTGAYVSTAELVTELDTAAPTGALLAEISVGEPCSPA